MTEEIKILTEGLDTDANIAKRVLDYTDTLKDDISLLIELRDLVDVYWTYDVVPIQGYCNFQPKTRLGDETTESIEELINDDEITTANKTIDKIDSVNTLKSDVKSSSNKENNKG